VRRLARGIEDAARENPVLARPLLRDTFGEIRLVPLEGTIYAVFEDAAERLLLAVGGTKISRVAGACKRAHLRWLRIA
jgi:hypothetical protein